MKKRYILYVFISILIISNVFLKTLYIDNTQMKGYQTESEKINYVFFDTLYTKNSKSFNLKNILGVGKEIQQVFCIWNGSVYFSYQYTEDSSLHWCIASLRLKDLKLNTIVDEIFNFVGNKEFLTYEINFDKDYHKRTGYYYDGKIVVTDFQKIIEYDLKDDTYNILQYECYMAPRQDVSYDIVDYQKVEFIQNAKYHIVDKTVLSQKSKVAKTLIKSNDNHIWDGSSSMTNFFDSVKFIDGRIYLFVRVLNFWGETYAIIFECNLETESYSYVGWHFTNDVINDDEFYIVPEGDQSGDG